MADKNAFSKLRDLCTDLGTRNHGAALKRALLAVAIPASAGLAVACYGMPLEEFEGDMDISECSDGLDNDGNGEADCDDESCGDVEYCMGGCLDLMDNDSDGSTDCDDASCAASPECE